MGSSRPSLKWNAIRNRWEAIGKGGVVIAAFGDGGVEVGRTGDNVSKIFGFVATLVGNTAIGSGFSPGVGTLQSATGSGVGCSEIAIGDKVFGNPKIALGAVGIAGFYVPTTSTLNVYLTGNTVDGSLAAGCGFDITAFRFA